MQHLNEFYRIIYAGGEFLTEGESQEVRTAVFGFLKHWAHLAEDAMQRKLRLWQVLPKHHYFAHIGLEAAFWNPRFVHTYIDESFIGRICEIFHASLDGMFEAVVQDNVTSKWLLGLHILLSSMK